MSFSHLYAMVYAIESFTQATTGKGTLVCALVSGYLAILLMLPDPDKPRKDGESE